LDATNVLKPSLTIITDISKDHIEILGNSLRRIAWEKAGIVKPHVPMLIGSLPAEAEMVIREVCRKREAPLVKVKRSKLKVDEPRLRLSYATDRFRVDNLSPALVGTHQLKNTAVVLEAINQLNSRAIVSISKTAALTGIRTTFWPGRFQVIHHPEGPLLVLDVAHNARGMEAFVDSFRRKFPGRQAKVLVGFVKRKPHQQMFDSLSAIAAEYAVVPLDTKRSIDIPELMATLRWRGIPHTRYGSVQTAYKKLMHSAAPNDIIVIIGSHYLLGEFMTLNGWQ
jgi:dihydrofolate synthase/folylpolyglutamate synthase